MSGLKHDLRAVQNWLHTSPELANVPQDLKSLQTSVVALGGEIRGLSTTVDKLKDDNLKLQNSEVAREQRIVLLEVLKFTLTLFSLY